MANIQRRYREHCHHKHGCATYADITEWSCGCVEVEIHRDRSAGQDCTARISAASEGAAESPECPGSDSIAALTPPPTLRNDPSL